MPHFLTGTIRIRVDTADPVSTPDLITDLEAQLTDDSFDLAHGIGTILDLKLKADTLSEEVQPTT